MMHTPFGQIPLQVLPDHHSQIGCGYVVFQCIHTVLRAQPLAELHLDLAVWQHGIGNAWLLSLKLLK